MTDTDTPKTSPLTILGAGFFVLLIIALVASFAFNTSNPKTSPPSTTSSAVKPPSPPTPKDTPKTLPPTTYLQPSALAFKPAPIPVETIQEKRAAMRKEYETSKIPKDSFKDPIQAFRSLNRIELEKKEDIRKAETGLEAQALDLYGLHGKAGLLALVDTTYPTFRDALKTLSEISKTSSKPILEVLQNPPADNPAVQDALEWTGNFVLVAVSIGLLNEDGTISPRLEPVLEILYRYRWFNSMRGTVNPKELMTGPELRTLLLWRLHEGKNIAPHNKVNYAIEAAKNIPGYPSTLAIGIVYHQSKQDQKALIQFQNARSLDPTQGDLADVYAGLLQKPGPSTPNGEKTLQKNPDTPEK